MVEHAHLTNGKNMKKTLVRIFAVLTMAISSTASAICFNMSVSNSGGALTRDVPTTAYEFSGGNCAGTSTFTFQDLSGNSPTAVIQHVIERNVNGQWKPYSKTTSYGSRSTTIYVPISAKGTFRYLIVNTGGGYVRNWTMSGRVML